MEAKIKNAIIKNVKIEANNGILTIWVDVDYGGSGQTFGGFNLYTPSEGLDTKNYTGHFIWELLKISGVNDISKVKGKSIRIKSTYRNIESIGHIVNDIWFNPVEDFKI